MNEVKRQEILSKTDEILYELTAIVLDDYDKKEHRENAEELIYVIQGLLDLYQKEKEKNKEYENKIKSVLELIDTKPYTAYTLYGDILYDDENIRELLEERD